MHSAQTDVEAVIRAHFDAGELDATASKSLHAYGDEVYSFLRAKLGVDSDAQEAFSMFAENMWRGLPAFAWRCTMRTWLFTLARNVAYRHGAALRRERHRHIRVAHFDALPQVATATPAQSPDLTDYVRNLREVLDPSAQRLLMLRMERGLSWRELARNMAENVHLSDVELAREAARLRKMFERLKKLIRAKLPCDPLEMGDGAMVAW